jgi:hypothetical protein
MVVSLYDQAARYAMKLDPAGFLCWLLAEAWPELVFTRWLDTQTIPFPGEAERRCDTVAEMVRRDGLGPHWALVAEAQTDPDPDILARLLEYVARLWRELRHGPHGRDRYLVAGTLVSLTGSGPAAEVDMILPGPGGLGFRWRHGGRVLANEDAAGTLARIEAGQLSRVLLPWVVLMRGGGEASTIADWCRLGEAEPDRRRRGDYGALARIFAELTGWKEAWHRALEDWNVEESPIFNKWIAESPTVKEWIAQGEGRGRADGLVAGRRDLLLRLVRAKFPGQVPPEVTGAIESQADADELSRWYDLALAASSLEQLRSTLGIAAGRPNGAAPPNP